MVIVGETTVATTVDDTVPALAVKFAVPIAFALATPVAETETTAGLSEAQTGTTPAMMLSFLSSTRAVTWVLWVSVIASVAGTTLIVAGSGNSTGVSLQAARAVTTAIERLQRRNDCRMIRTSVID